jgi:hypothetical protein
MTNEERVIVNILSTVAALMLAVLMWYLDG